MSDRDRSLTPNQLVAQNLQFLRQLKRLTQEQAAALAAPYLGVRWSKNVWSNAERSVDSDSPRQFSADDVVALARTFDVSPLYFFLPADHSDSAVKTPDYADGLPRGQYLDLLVADTASLMYERLTGTLTYTPMEELSERQQVWQRWGKEVEESVLRKTFEDMDEWRKRFLYLAQMFLRVENGLWAAQIPSGSHEVSWDAEATGMPRLTEGVADSEPMFDTSDDERVSVEPDLTEIRIANTFFEDFDAYLITNYVRRMYQMSSSDHVERTVSMEPDEDWKENARKMAERNLAIEVASNYSLRWNTTKRVYVWPKSSKAASLDSSQNASNE